MLERDEELAALTRAAVATAQGQGCLLLVEGPAGIGKTTLLRAACTGAIKRDLRVLTARGRALEGGFPYGVVRQLIEPVRATAAPDEWAGLLDGAAGLASRVFDQMAPASVEDDVPYATMHGLYWLIANLATRRPLVIAVDDAHWADPPSLRWLAHLAGRLDGLPVLLLLALRSGPGASASALLDELRAGAADVPLRPAPLGEQATAVLVRERLGGAAGAELCRACHASTGGNPFLLESLVSALRAEGAAPAADAVSQVGRLGPESVARAVLRRVAQLQDGAEALTRALAVLGGPTPLRHAAALAGQDLDIAARLADSLRAADVLTPGRMLEFAHPIVRSAIYEAIPPGERGLAHASAARLLNKDRAPAERVALHLLRSEPAGSADVVALLRAAATAATGRGAPDAAAACLRRALDEPPGQQTRPAVLLELGLALAAARDRDAPGILREAVECTTEPSAHATAALLSARALGLWGHHDNVTAICRSALATGDALDPAQAGSLEAELAVNAFVSPVTVAEARDRTRRQLHRADASSQCRINAAVADTWEAQPASKALHHLAAVLASGMADVPPDSMAAVCALFVLIWNDEPGTAGVICDRVLASARARGSMSMIAHASCVSSMISRRCGRLEDAAADGKLALDFKLATSPPLAIAWAAALCIEALTGLGRFDEADGIAEAAAATEPPPGYLHTLVFLQARGALRVAEGRFADALSDLLTAGEGWNRLGVEHPAVGAWRTDAAAAHAALDHPEQAAALAAEQLTLAQQVGTPVTLGNALRAYAAAAARDQSQDLLTEAVSLLEHTPARVDLAHALTDLGMLLRRSGRPLDARTPLRRALDLADRAGAAPLAQRARRELTVVGARPRRTALTGPDALTSAERQVAHLAAEGRSNRQIAQHLFITQPTVETHLRHAFHKLRITSRTQLPTVLSAHTDASPATPGAPAPRPATVGQLPPV